MYQKTTRMFLKSSCQGSFARSAVKIEIIFRGTGKRIKAIERNAYHKEVDVFFQLNAWADTEVSCEWAATTLKEAVTPGEEFILICDNLNSQTSEEFKKAVRDINGIVYYGIPGE